MKVVVFLLLLFPLTICAVDKDQADQALEAKIEGLDEPLYNPFVERYLMDEVKQIRLDQLEFKNQVLQEVRNREVGLVDRAIGYVTDAMTYVFYLIAAVSSLLVIVGWNSLRDIKQKALDLADHKVSNLVDEYEGRLKRIERELMNKSQSIEENRQEIERTQEIHSLWLRASQENSPATKVEVYDEILQINREDVEAMTYKADAVLELDQPVWALNLCKQALTLDSSNGFAHFQAACALAVLGQMTEAHHHLTQAVKISVNYLELIEEDDALKALREEEGYSSFIEELETLVSLGE